MRRAGKAPARSTCGSVSRDRVHLVCMGMEARNGSCGCIQFAWRFGLENGDLVVLTRALATQLQDEEEQAMVGRIGRSDGVVCVSKWSVYDAASGILMSQMSCCSWTAGGGRLR